MTREEFEAKKKILLTLKDAMETQESPVKSLKHKADSLMDQVEALLAAKAEAESKIDAYYATAKLIMAEED